MFKIQQKKNVDRSDILIGKPLKGHMDNKKKPWDDS